MTIRHILVALALFPTSSAGIAAPSSIPAMKWQRRVLLVSTPQAGDPKLALQRRTLANWQKGAADRDMSFVTLTGDHVDGATDRAADLRTRYHVDGTTFQALLIGKDGHVAMRSTEPIDASILEGTIDAMPMRKNGQR
jgi:Domain of unknown function (DUF4174)